VQWSVAMFVQFCCSFVPPCRIMMNCCAYLGSCNRHIAHGMHLHALFVSSLSPVHYVTISVNC